MIDHGRTGCRRRPALAAGRTATALMGRAPGLAGRAGSNEGGGLMARDGAARRAVQVIVTTAATRLTPPQLPANDGAQGAALSGTFAASMERLLKIAARSLPAPAVLIAMHGDD